MNPRRPATTSRATPSDALPEGVPSHNPWERYSWVIRSVWLIFLVFPVLAIWASPEAAWLRVLGLALVLVFGLVYALGGQHLDRL